MLSSTNTFETCQLRAFGSRSIVERRVSSNSVALDDHVRRGGDRDPLPAVAHGRSSRGSTRCVDGTAALVTAEVHEVAVHVGDVNMVELDAVRHPRSGSRAASRASARRRPCDTPPFGFAPRTTRLRNTMLRAVLDPPLRTVRRAARRREHRRALAVEGEVAPVPDEQRSLDAVAPAATEPDLAAVGHLVDEPLQRLGVVGPPGRRRHCSVPTPFGAVGSPAASGASSAACATSGESCRPAPPGSGASEARDRRSLPSRIRHCRRRTAPRLRPPTRNVSRLAALASIQWSWPRPNSTRTYRPDSVGPTSNHGSSRSSASGTPSRPSPPCERNVSETVTRIRAPTRSIRWSSPRRCTHAACGRRAGLRFVRRATEHSPCASSCSSRRARADSFGPVAQREVGTTGFDGGELGPRFTLLLAATVHVYVRPAVRPLTRIGDFGPTPRASLRRRVTGTRRGSS